MSWSSSKLGNVLTKVIDNRGKTPPLTSEGIELIETTSLTGGNKFPDYLLVRKHVSKEVFDRWFRAGHPQKGDILIATVGANIGSVAIMKEARGCVAQNLVGLRANDQIDADFLYYFLAWSRTQHELKRMDIGAAQPSLKVPHLLGIHVLYPPLPVQHRIGSILSTYDDLIENNTRRIRILEQMAQMLYREWFVTFRFPNHETVKTVDSKLGMLPEGWSIEPIANVAEILGGGTPATGVPEYWQDGDIDWYSPTDLTATNSMFMFGSSKKISKLGLKKSSARLFPTGSVMMTSRATIGVVSINRGEACTNQGFITCVPGSRVSLFQVYFWLLENKDKITNLATGATFKEINKRTFRELQIVVASPDICEAFVNIMSPIGGLIENLLQRNSNLRRTRDLLLPKLVSGEVSIANLEQEALAETV